MTSNDHPGSTRIVAGEPRGTNRPRGRKIGLAIGLILLIGASAVTAALSITAKDPQPAAVAAGPNPAAELRLGYFANITHAPALAALRI